MIQENENLFRKTGQILHVLPYHIPKPDEHKTPEEFYDPNDLLSTDQREIWWGKYWRIKGHRDKNAMPAELKTLHLTEITAQPLLNYLVALSYERNQLKFDVPPL